MVRSLSEARIQLAFVIATSILCVAGCDDRGTTPATASEPAASELSGRVAPEPAPVPKAVEAEPGVPVGLQVGQRAPDFEVQDVDGVRFRLSDYRGKVVVLDFWGFW